jgi:hypothetical protein
MGSSMEMSVTASGDSKGKKAVSEAAASLKTEEAVS